MVTNFNSLGNSDLEFPLRRSNFSIDSSNLNASIQASSQVSFSHCSTKVVSFSDGTIISALRVRETTIWPTQWPYVGGACSFLKEIFLLNSEPRLLFLRFLHNLT